MAHIRLIYTANVFCPRCTTIQFASRNHKQRLCHFSQQFTTHSPTSHFLQKYSELRVCLCGENTRHRRCFPSEGQCCESFTSSRLSWDAAGLGLPLEVPLNVTLPSCEWIINSRTRISWKYLYVIVPPHDLCATNAFRMVMFVR